jgi:large subunit ribosomal protein L24
MLKLKVGDTVKVVAGKDKGKEANIEKIFPKTGKVGLPGINLYKRHVKAQVSLDGKGGIYEIPRPMSVAKVALICPNCKKITRVGFEVKDGKKVRVCRKCGKVIDGAKIVLKKTKGKKK